MSQVYFRSVKHAVAYNKYRATMPDAVIQRIISYVNGYIDTKNCHLLDVGCGTGLSTRPLAPYFRHATGIEPSEAYVEEAKQQTTETNISFLVGNAEKLPVNDASVEVVSCMAAAHWFDLDNFFKEVNRVLKPGGVLSVSTGAHGYFIPGHEEEFLKLFLELTDKDTAQHWSPQVKISMNLYKNIILPFTDQIRDTSISIEEPMTVEHFMGRIRTLSGIAKCLEEDPQLAEKSLSKFQFNLMKMIGSTSSPEQTSLVVGKHYVVLLSRKPL